METYNFLIEEEEVGTRIDRYLTDMNEDWSRNQIQDWIKLEIGRAHV